MTLFILFLFAKPECMPMCQKIKKISDEKAKYDELLKKNRAFLSGLASDDISKKVKVNSNILIISAKIETFQNEIVHEKNQITSKGCPLC